MKKTIKILSIALAAGMISMLSVKAEEPAAADYAASGTFSEVVMEQELKVEDWMLEPSVTEGAIELEEWMLNPIESESQILVQDWMLIPFRTDHQENMLALEEWMLSFS